MQNRNFCFNCGRILEKKIIDLPSFTHFNFELFDKENIFYLCEKCNFISKKKIDKKKLNFFNSKKYSFVDHNQKSFNKRKYYLKHEVQFEFIKKNKLFFEGIKVLDIGCNNGDLINLIRKNIKNSFCKGYDKNPYIKKKLINKNLFFDYRKNSVKKFDLIIMSHSIIYFEDLNKIMYQLSKNLSKNGIIFLENSDFSRSAYYLLMGDQYFFFTPFFLQKFFLKYKYFSKIFYPSNLKGNFVMLFSKKKFFVNNKFKKYDFKKSINYLNTVKNYLMKIKVPKIYILGTTVKAAFLNYFIENKVKSFVDENLNKKNFLNKRVIHPQKLKKEYFILVPLKDKKNILKKLNKSYKGRFKIL